MTSRTSRSRARATRRDRAVWIVLAHGWDESALWVFEGLRSRARSEVRLVLVEELDPMVGAWTHRVGDHGSHTTLAMTSGQRLRSEGVRGVLNRVMSAPPRWLAEVAQTADGRYGQIESTAFAMSWIRSLAPLVVNPPTARGLCGAWRSPFQWRVLASRAGLPVVPLRRSSDDVAAAEDSVCPSASTILSIDGQLQHDGAPAGIRAAARRLAVLSQTMILGLRFLGADPALDGWRLLDATPQPDLRAAGARSLIALEALMER
jgi:hypothetical protein